MATGEEITLDVDGANAACYLAKPDGDGNGIGLVVVHEWWGLNEHTRDVARRYADAGFVALAPDLYDGVVAKDAKEASQRMHALDVEVAIAVLDASVERLASADGVDSGRIGVTGFCMGGSLALLLACRNSAVRAAAPFYGDIPSDDDLAKLSGPVFFVGASKDGWITPAKIEGLRESAERLGKDVTTKIYEGADHAFFNDTRPEVYDAAAAADAWTRVTSFFRDRLTTHV